MTTPTIDRRWWRASLAIALIACAACSRTSHRYAHGVPIDARPTPQPADSTHAAAKHAPRPQPKPRQAAGTRAHVLADTTAAHAALARCAGRKLLPDQEGVHDATLQSLMAARDALVRGDLEAAAAAARNARQMSSSLSCP